MHYRQVWEHFNNKKIPKDHEIHHIDGDRSNNHPTNLKCVSLSEHLEIHLRQEDWGAVFAILSRMENSNSIDIATAARKHQRRLLEEGRHNFQRMSGTRRTEISKTTIDERIKKHGVAFLGIENTTQNARNAGKVSAEKQAGFLDTQSKNHGSKHVKGTSWWSNVETGERVRSSCPPNGNWKRGMK